MKIFGSNENLSDINPDLVVITVFDDDICEYDAFAEFYKYAKEKMNFTQKYLETVLLPTYWKTNADNVLFLGLGNKEEFNLNKIRIAISKTLQKINTDKAIKKVAIIAEGIAEEIDIVAQNIAEGVLIGLYNFDKYKTVKKNRLEEIVIVSKQDISGSLKKAEAICSAVNNARDLINEPAEIVTPQKLADLATEIEGIETKVYSAKEAKEMGMGAFLAVGQGSRHEQKFIHMKYIPCGAKKSTIALVGKGITFDSGGLDIKPAASMLEMKGDMAGAASVISIMKALTILKPDVEVHGIIAACENMPASRSYKPGDVLTAMNGKTIEVDNTDAEGRLTLADALCYAESLKPDAIIDIATLTGACCVALGKVASGLLGNDDNLIVNLQVSAEESGEYLWEMPMYEEYFEDLKSDIADFKNSGSRYGGTSAAALFLKNFVEKTPWAHLDIAGTSILNKPLRELPKGASGVGVRTLINYICNL